MSTTDQNASATTVPTTATPSTTEERTTMSSSTTIPTIVGSVAEPTTKSAKIAPIVSTTKGEADPIKAQAAYDARQAKRNAISGSTLNPHQKETIGAILDKETDRRVTVNTDSTESAQAIMKYDDLIATSKLHAALTPSAYETRPAWINEKDWNRARKAFARLYVTVGASAFDKDLSGRLIMPLPLTAGRFTAMIANADVSNVVRYAGTLDASKDASYKALVALDDVAPIVAKVYRAGAAYNAACVKLDKAVKAVDVAAVDTLDKAIERRDVARKAVDVASSAFVAAYMDSFKSMADVSAKADSTRAALLKALTVKPSDDQGVVIGKADSFDKAVSVPATK